MMMGLGLLVVYSRFQHQHQYIRPLIVIGQSGHQDSLRLSQLFDQAQYWSEPASSQSCSPSRSAWGWATHSRGCRTETSTTSPTPTRSNTGWIPNWFRTAGECSRALLAEVSSQLELLYIPLLLCRGRENEREDSENTHNISLWAALLSGLIKPVRLNLFYLYQN